jgi:TorA maturation chaperone TorD
MDQTPGAGVVDEEILASKSRERGNLYGFLACVYRREPTVDLIHRIKDPAFLEALTDAGVELRDYLDRPDHELLAELGQEYTRLFLGPGKHVSPHESVHVPGGGSLWGEATSAVKKFIEQVGVDYRPDYTGIPDHISVELEFMQRLTDAEARAWAEGDEARAADCLSIERRFIEKHLFRWSTCFCENVIREARLPFYAQLAAMTSAFIASESTAIGEGLDDTNRPLV